MSAVVVTGAAGFLGRHLLAHFLGQGRDVLALTRDTRRLDDVVHPRLRVIATDYGALEDVLPRGCSVIHLAAQRNMPCRDADAFTTTNVALAERVARAALARQATRFVNISTALVLVASDAGGAYVQSRAAGLAALERVAGEGLPLVSLLPTIIFGPDHPRAPNRITTYIRRLLRAPLRVSIGRTSAPRNLVYVDDVTRSIAFAEGAGIVGRYVVSGENVTQEELDRAVRPRPRIVVPRVAALAAARTMDAVLRFDAASGWHARVRTLLAPWSVQPYQTLGCEPTPFATALQRTVAAA